ncbi:MAG TPA: glycosyltransferase family 9 protein [Gemmatimonadaceae bacterium]|nr:glycosyltransferase family 9 protein [Gemmatimonadaceae bacterium]
MNAPRSFHPEAAPPPEDLPEGAPPSTDPSPRPPSLVVQTSFLGDVVLTTPLIRELASRGPVDVVTTPAAAPLLAGNPDIRHHFVFDKRGAHAGVGGLRRMAREIRDRTAAGGRGAAYLAQGSLRSAALALLAGYRERVGFDSSPGRVLYTRRVVHRDDRHHAERLWRLAGAAAPDGSPGPVALRPRLFPSAADAAAVDALLGPDAAAPTIALAPGSVWGTKRWPYYSELARRLAPHARIVVVGGAADGEMAAAIEAAARDAARFGLVDATGKLSLLASAELIGRAAALVTNDSLPQHLASAMGTPTVTIFGPTVPSFGFGPLAPGSRTAGLHALPCRPCHHHGPPRCPLKHWRCMRDLDVSRIEALLDTITNR